MTFCYTEKPFSSSFAGNSFPKLLSICKVEKSHTMMPRLMHKHDDRLEVLLLVSGKGTHIIDGEEYQTSKGDILIFNRGSLHDEQANTDVDMSVFCMAVTDLKLPNLPLNHLVPANARAVIPSGEDYSELYQLFDMIYRHTREKDYRYEELANYLVRGLLVRIDGKIRSANQAVGPADNVVGQRIKDYIDDHYTDDIDLACISQHFQMNQYYVAHVFKATFGIAPMQYVIRRRIGEAQSLLINTELDVTQVAMQVGYNSLSHFQNTYTKIVGMPPGKYRKHWNK